LSLAARRPGAPLAALLTVIVLWVAGRAVLWETPLLPRVPLAPVVEALLADVTSVDAEPGVAAPVIAAPSDAPGAGLELLMVEAHAVTAVLGPSSATAPATEPIWPQVLAVIHQETAALAAPEAGLHSGFGLTAPLPSPTPRSLASGRWVADTWLFLRPGSDPGTTGAPVQPSYGASQAGAVLRYRLSSDGRAPVAYLRAISTIATNNEREAAVGLSVRPLRRVPILAMAEARLLETRGQTELRPAAMIVSEFPLLGMGDRAQAEGYVQAGYVGGRFATAFADGQFRLTREVARFEHGTVRAGAGAWGGIQRGAARFDLGPTASVDLQLGVAAARVAIDYRFRAAGDAQPDSGPTLTLSTGF
jgi:hypothetical protein